MILIVVSLSVLESQGPRASKTANGIVNETRASLACNRGTDSSIRVRALAEAEGRAHEAKLAEEVNRRMQFDHANAEKREKWVATINTTFEHIGVGGV
ncbi:hypothetical protein K1719_018449 [Acacia pycnantha]|nr:hypothetical protein K1719_018449 [Acacia pycnantha]